MYINHRGLEENPRTGTSIQEGSLRPFTEGVNPLDYYLSLGVSKKPSRKHAHKLAEEYKWS